MELKPEDPSEAQIKLRITSNCLNIKKKKKKTENVQKNTVKTAIKSAL